MVTFLAVSIVLLLVGCCLFGGSADGPNPFSSSVVMLFLVIVSLWFLSDDSNAGSSMVRSDAITVSRAGVW